MRLCVHNCCFGRVANRGRYVLLWPASVSPSLVQMCQDGRTHRKELPQKEPPLLHQHGSCSIADLTCGSKHDTGKFQALGLAMGPRQATKSAVGGGARGQCGATCRKRRGEQHVRDDIQGAERA